MIASRIFLNEDVKEAKCMSACARALNKPWKVLCHLLQSHRINIWLLCFFGVKYLGKIKQKKIVYVFGMWRTEARFGSDFETELTHIQAHWMIHEYVYEYSALFGHRERKHSCKWQTQIKKKDEDNKAKQHSRRFRAYILYKHKKPNPNGNHLIFINSKLFMRLEK